MFNKIHIIIGILIFLIVTEYVYLSDTKLKGRRIYVSTKPVSINQKNADFLSQESKISVNSPKFKNKQIKTQNIETKTTDINSKKAQFNNTSQGAVNIIEFRGFDNNNDNQNTKLTNNDLENKNNNFKNHNSSFENSIPSKNLQKQELKEPSLEKAKQEEANNPLEDFVFSTIDWNNWRSRFLNQILDDSSAIPSLNEYEAGSWLYFSFNVTNQGEIKDIHINSFFLTDEDKRLFKELIKSYEKEEITKFPPNSRRKQVKVKAFYVLDTEEKRARPEDFFDSERVRVK